MTFTPQEILLAEKLNTELLAKASSAHTHTASQISDSTVAGRTLLTATNATAQKAALAVTKADVGLGNVDNTPDVAKPVSTAQATAIATKADAVHQHNAADINAGALAAARYSTTLSAALDALTSAVAGDIAYRGPSGWVRLPKGAAGQFLQMGASAPAWVTVTGFTPSTDVIPANTVLPVLSGNYQTGQTLSTTDGTWTGSPAPTFTYQWYSAPIPASVPPLEAGQTAPPFDPSPLTAIPGATSSTYVIANAMLGLVLYAKVTATNAAGSTVAYTLQSGVVAAPPSLIPVATFIPQITGTTQVGSTLTTTAGTWTNSPTSYTYQWRRNGTPIPGATASTYVLVTADIGAAMTVAVVAANASGTGVASVSSATPTVLADALTIPVLVSAPVIAAVSLVEGSTVTSFDAGWLEVLTAPQNTVLPTITGNATQGSTLTGATGTWLANPTATYAYEWRRSGTPISGATASTYVLTGSDVGATITLRIVATNTSGTGAAVSNSTNVVAATASAPVNTVLPVISGTATQGQTLSVASGTPVVIDPANLAGTAVLTFNEDWDTLDLYNGTTGKWATGFHWYPPQGGSLNDEQQWYIQNTYAPTSAVVPWSVSSSVLSITANPTPSNLLSTVNNFAYTSGMLTSYRSFSQQYGYFEAKLQLPKGQGMWPAFWMLPADGGWPPEIDVMEFLGRDPTHYYATTHWSSTNQQVGTYVATPDLSLDWHRYGVRWDATNVTYFFDGLQVAQHANQSDMNKPFYMLLNLAIGGSWGGSVDGTTTFPATLKCDWVRAYTATSSTPGTWTGTPTSYAFQWKRGGVAISGATSNSYVLQAPDVGSTITVTVTATNAAGSASATSTATATVTGSGGTINANLLAHPTQMASSSGFWSGGGDAPLATAASSTDIAAPDGSSTVFKITAGHSGLGYNTWGDTAVTAAATTKTLSAYAAAGASSYISFDLYDTGDHFITFSLSGAGSVTQTSGLTSSITRVGAGPWYLISATWTPTTTTQYPVLAMAGSGTQPTDLTGVTVYVTRPKYEDGASVTGQPTSF